jgi:Zn-dependent protease with chaperone function
MSKYCQILLAEAYILLTGAGVIDLLRCWGLCVSRPLTVGLLLAWTAACFSSAYFLAGIFLAGHQVRKPVKDEDAKLNAYFGEVLHAAGTDKPFRILIQEETGCNAFATGLRTIVVTRGLLERMEPAEIKGVLAHELGHLQSKDCLVGAAFASAGLLPLLVTVVFGQAKRILLRALGFSIAVLNIFGWFLLPVLVISLTYWLYSRHVLLPMAATAVFVWFFRKAHALFRFCWRMNARFREYQQDAYAFDLGYGSGLRQALLKWTVSQPQSVSLYEILISSDHPVIYNRIRRLEKWEGLR